MGPFEKTIKALLDEKQNVMEGAFRHASIGADAHLSFVQAVGKLQGIDLALQIITGAVRGENDDE